MNYKLEKGIPIPEKHSWHGTRRHAKYPFKTMDVGDSFEFPVKLRKKITAAASYHGSAHGRKISIRRVSNAKARAWRVR